MPPYPKLGDYEWALRMSIDKWFLMTQYPKIENSGAGSCALCIAAGHLSDMDNQCNDCPVKVKTGVPSCRNTPFSRIQNAKTWDECKDIYIEIYSKLKELYLELYGSAYETKIIESV
jgi:hypothetical protein